MPKIQHNEDIMISFDQFISRMPDPEEFPNFLWNGPFISNLVISEIDITNEIVFFQDGTPITFTAMEQNYSAIRVLPRKEMGEFIYNRTQRSTNQSGS